MEILLNPTFRRQAAKAFALTGGGAALAGCGSEAVSNKDAVQPRTSCEATVSGASASAKLYLDGQNVSDRYSGALAVAGFANEAPQTTRFEDGALTFSDTAPNARITTLAIKNLSADDATWLDADWSVPCRITVGKSNDESTFTPEKESNLPTAGY